MKTLAAAVSALRPTQWTKNLVVFAGVIFAMRLTNPMAVVRTVILFVAFCLLAGSTYVFNDLLDRERDRLHPVKRDRAIASGRLSASAAWGLGVGALAVGSILALASGPLGLASAIAYLALTLSYQLVLKQVVLLDVMVLAAGFAVRAASGALVIGVKISPWLIICSALLAVFLALAKRRYELRNLGEGAAGHRPVLAAYSVELVDELLSVTASSTIVAYSLYTFLAHRSGWMMLTVPFVIYGVFRYLFLVHSDEKGGSPEVVLVTDAPMMACVVMWALSCVAVLWLLR